MRRRKIDRFLGIEHGMQTVACEILGNHASLSNNPSLLYEEATHALITQLLDRDNIKKQGSHSISNEYDFSAEEIGKLYEYLRGFKLEISNECNVRLAPSPKGKRNQGLFYTPELIVKHIVTGTLDALAISSPEDYLDVKILDPAMGTGVFLAETLEQLTERALQAEPRLVWKKLETSRSALEAVIEPNDCSQVDIGHLQRLVKAYIFINGIYGVDLDPIAVRIGKAILCEKAFGRQSHSSQVPCNLRVGNSLMGTVCGQSDSLSKANEDRRHASLYLRREDLNQAQIGTWTEMKRVFHWPLEYPEVFSESHSGFDAVIGNPPYEIVSVKESGIRDRKRDQQYYREAYRSCYGKINTYRLMLERGLDLLNFGGVLGFIVPATLLADTTAAQLRQIILDESEILEAMVIPEKARLFVGVTQALLILLTRKGPHSPALELSFWEDNDQIANENSVRITRKILNDLRLRVPLVRGMIEARLLEALGAFPPLGGNENESPVCRVHQGEVNLTVHEDYITHNRTDYPLVRGEHINPFQVVHPTPGRARLDWVEPEFFDHLNVAKDKRGHALSRRSQKSRRGVDDRNPWEIRRIVLGRVVNMGTYRRLKAAVVPPGYLLGDMTNFIIDMDIPLNYVLGLLNSKLLNWRIRVTSTNNYVSAAEILALPVPRIENCKAGPPVAAYIRKRYAQVFNSTTDCISESVRLLQEFLQRNTPVDQAMLLADMLECVVQELVSTKHDLIEQEREHLVHILDGAVLLLYGVEDYVEVFDNQQPTGLA